MFKTSRPQDLKTSNSNFLLKFILSWMLFGGFSLHAQWSTTSTPSAFTNKQVEIGPLPDIPNAWVNTYSNACSNPNNNPDIPPSIPANLETNHIRMRQNGDITIFGEPDPFVLNPNQSGFNMDCSLTTDYYFKTNMEQSKLFLTSQDNNSNNYTYMSFWKDNMAIHQDAHFMVGLHSSGYSSFANLFATTLVAPNSSITDLVVDNLTVNNRPTLNNGLKIKNSSLQITDANDNIIWNFRNDGKLGIGVATAEMNGPYWLWVKEGIMTERLKVAVKGTNDWADYVFAPDYKLMSLSDLETYVTTNKHLPDLPSAEEVVKEGIDVQKMDATLLQKIEELTLYVIELKKEINALKSKKSTK